MYSSKTTLVVLKVPIASMSITVRKALNERPSAGHRKFPAAPDTRCNDYKTFSMNGTRLQFNLKKCESQIPDTILIQILKLTTI